MNFIRCIKTTDSNGCAFQNDTLCRYSLHTTVRTCAHESDTQRQEPTENSINIVMKNMCTRERCAEGRVKAVPKTNRNGKCMGKYSPSPGIVISRIGQNVQNACNATRRGTTVVRRFSKRTHPFCVSHYVYCTFWKLPHTYSAQSIMCLTRCWGEPKKSSK